LCGALAHTADGVSELARDDVLAGEVDSPWLVGLVAFDW
jgi:hypothetical protein